MLVHRLGLLSLASALALSFYQVYGTAAVVGWVSGNVYVARRRRLVSTAIRRRALVLWLIGPQGIPSLLWAMAPASLQAAAPAVPFYAFLVGTVFFAVPLVFGRRG